MVRGLFSFYSKIYLRVVGRFGSCFCHIDRKKGFSKDYWEQKQQQYEAKIPRQIYSSIIINSMSISVSMILVKEKFK
jgi:hypothetical protein